MLLILGTISIGLGMAAIFAAGHYPSSSATIQRWGGRFVITGIALAGLGFPLI
jgi:hypothetical protein